MQDASRYFTIKAKRGRYLLCVETYCPYNYRLVAGLCWCKGAV